LFRHSNGEPSPVSSICLYSVRDKRSELLDSVAFFDGSAVLVQVRLGGGGGLHAGSVFGQDVADAVEGLGLAGLADNEHILAGMDRLMLKLADSETADEHSITEEIEELERQLAYYRKQIVS
jgi:hypothetical protein